jgi:hypothetical protein
MNPRRDRKRKLVDVSHFLQSCKCALTETDSNTLLTIIRHGREELAQLQDGLRAGERQRESRQLELPRFRTGRLREMAARAESLATALDSLEAEATKRGFTMSPRQSGRIGKDAA